MSEADDLARLAHHFGLETTYRDIGGQMRRVPGETVRAILKAMGIDADDRTMLAAAVERARAESWQRPLPPAVVATAGETPRIKLNLAAALSDVPLVWRLDLEAGDRRGGEVLISQLALEETATLAGESRERRWLHLPDDLPEGYHHLMLEAGKAGAPALYAQCRLIVCPHRCVTPAEKLHDGRTWGCALQLYGLRSAGNWGMGDFADLAELAMGMAALGADTLGINPLHALFPADPGHFGPYGPSNRQFLNVLYIRPELVPEFADCAEARAAASAPEVQRRLDSARAGELVDYSEASALKLPVLEQLYRDFRDHHLARPDSPRAAAFRAYCREMGEALDEHACFDALHEHFFGRDRAKWSWTTWPEPFRDVRSAEVERFAQEKADRITFFKYLQWLADEQLGAAQGQALAAGMAIGLYGDLAVAAHPGGSMAWRSPGIVLSGVSVGAPPDDFNRQGQNWGLAALSPNGLHEAEYEPFAAILRANMRHAGALRIDHVMGLTRQYWIPDGAPATAGGYVTYPLRDLLAIVALESRRNDCLVIGEDLGTVPEGFREVMSDAGILSYRVLYFERESDGRFTPPERYPELSLVTATTHDLPPLTGFWRGRDLVWRDALGMFADAESSRAADSERSRDRALLLQALRESGHWSSELASLQDDPGFIKELIAAIYGHLASSPGALLMVSLEDVLMDLEQANLPGTSDQHPNWRRKLSKPLERLFDEPALARIVAAITRHRPARTSPGKRHAPGTM